jgi:hypothetical protein
MKRIFLLLYIFAIAGCDQIKDEFHTSGGYPAQLLDTSTFIARTQREHLHRYYYILATVAPMALYSANDEAGAQDAILHTNSAIKKINAFNQAIEVCNTHFNAHTTCTDLASSASIKDTSYGFESNSLEVQRAIWLLGSDVKNNIGIEIKVNDPAAIVKSSLSLLSKAKSLTGPFRNFTAAYRDSLHITTQSTYRTCTAAIELSSTTKATIEALQEAEQNAEDAQKASQKVLDSIAQTNGETQAVTSKALHALASDTVAKSQALSKSLVGSNTLAETLDKAKKDAAKKRPKCASLISAVNDFYIKGEKLNGVLRNETLIERQLKILQIRTLDVVESNELDDIGFLDTEALNALNLLIQTACTSAAKHTDSVSCGKVAQQKTAGETIIAITKIDPPT